MPEVSASIVINNYNYGRYLADAIRSALNQDYPRVEVVVVDDGSTDDSRAVIESFGDQIVPVFQPNRGHGGAFNNGFAHSKGDVVIFLDADDVLFPDAVSRFVPIFDDPTIVHCLGNLALCDADLRPLGRNFTMRPVDRGDLKERVLRYGPWAYLTIPTSGNAFARHYLAQVLPMPEADYRMGGDDFLSIISPLYGRIGAVEEPTAWYRLHGNNVYWRRRLSIDDLRTDFEYFERDARIIADHARRLGLSVDIAEWQRRDWRQQVRERILWLSGERTARPTPAEIVFAGILDQTRPHKKAVLLPMLLLFACSPRKQALDIGLRLLGRSK